MSRALNEFSLWKFHEYQYNKYKDRGMRIAHCFDPVFTFDKEWLKKV